MTSTSFSGWILGAFALALAIMAFPHKLLADQPDPNVAQQCKQVAACPKAGPACFSKCVSALNSCFQYNGDTGEFEPKNRPECFDVFVDFKKACGQFPPSPNPC